MEKEEKEIEDENESIIYTHLRKNIGVYIIITLALVIIAPWLLTRASWFGDCSQFGPDTSAIADTIGGITAPIIGFLSAILVYLAFREQRRAIKEQAKDNAKAIELQEKAIKQQAQDNAEANRLQLEAIKQQAQDNAEANKLQLKAIEQQAEHNEKAYYQQIKDMNTQFFNSAEANRLQREAIKKQAKDNEKVYNQQMSVIKKQAEENAFTHEKALFIDILKDLKKFMTDSPSKFILNIPTYNPDESDERKKIIREYTQYYRKNKVKLTDTCLQLQFNFLVLKEGKYSSLFINDYKKWNTGVNAFSQLTRQIQELSLEIESFLYLFSILQNHLQQNNDEHQITTYILFKETEKVYLFYYAWIWGILKDKKFDLDKMSDGTDNYEHLKKRIDLANKQYLELEKNQLFQLTYVVD